MSVLEAERDGMAKALELARSRVAELEAENRALAQAFHEADVDGIKLMLERDAARDSLELREMYAAHRTRQLYAIRKRLANQRRELRLLNRAKPTPRLKTLCLENEAGEDAAAYVVHVGTGWVRLLGTPASVARVLDALGKAGEP